MFALVHEGGEVDTLRGAENVYEESVGRSDQFDVSFTVEVVDFPV